MPILPHRVTYIACGGATKTRRLHHTSHRAFVQWFETAKPRFAMPARLATVQRDAIAVALHSDTIPVPGCVLGPLPLHHLPRLLAIMASTTRQPNTTRQPKQEILCWIPDLGHSLSRTSAGWHCRQPPPEHHCLHPSREAAWVAHLFEPFLAHINHLHNEKKPPPEPGVQLLHFFTHAEAGEWSLDPIASPSHGDIRCRLHP